MILNKLQRANILRTIAGQAAVLMLIALPLSACVPAGPPDVPPPEQCAPAAADEHLFYAANVTYVDPSPVAWKTARPAEVGLDAALLETAAEEAALSRTVASLLVIRDGRLAFERYFNGSDAAQAHNVQSLSKSILSVVVGIAIKEGLFALETPLAEILPANLTGANGDLTVRNLLTMSAGLEIDEQHENDYIAQWEAEGRSFVRAALESGRRDPPGEVFDYLTLLTEVLSAVIAESSGVSTCDYTTDRLFTPLGIEADHWRRDPDGYHAGGHSLFLTPREIGRFGQLVLQGGAWEGRQLVPEEWLAESLRETWDVGCRPFATGYGYLWWLHELDGRQIWSASGFGGQELLIVPDLELIVVMTHTTGGDPADFQIVPALDLLRTYVIPAATGQAGPILVPECERAADIVSISPDGSGRTVILEATTGIAPWSWSPDGDRIALHANQAFNDEIYTMAAAGSGLQRLTRDFAPDIMPAWSPDGATIAFVRGEPGDSDLYLTAADGSNPTRLTALDGYEHSPAWSPDGESLAFIWGQGDALGYGESGALWTIAADGSNPRPLLDGPLAGPSWSPAGNAIAYESHDEEPSRIKVLDLDTGLVADLGPGTMPRWSPDGARLVFAASRSGNLDIYIMEADGSNVQQLTSGPATDTLPLWSADGETILFVSIGN